MNIYKYIFVKIFVIRIAKRTDTLTLPSWWKNNVPQQAQKSIEAKQ